MLDTLGLPQTSRGYFQRFTAQGGTNEWQTWAKPRNVTMVGMRAISSGGGGGGGFTAVTGSARGGGGGGACGAVTDLIIPAYMLPDILYICVPIGGKGGAAGTIGTVGVRTRITLVPNDITTTTNLICVAGGSDSGAGGAGTGAAGGAAGSGATGANANTALGHNYAISASFKAGLNASAGGAQTGAAGGAVAIAVGLFLTGGTGGAGTGTANTDFAGGAITGLGQLPGIAGGLAAGGNGNSGYFSERPIQLFLTGGTGGGSNGAAGVAGAGGRGNYGSGGGGGGGGVTGGAGGDGGDGMALIWAW